MKFIQDLIQFLKNVSKDEKIPERDKVVLMALITLLVSPFDLIPDWIPFFGQLDDLIIIGLILDYFFKVLDSEILLSHWPWDMKMFIRVKKISHLLEFFVPKILKKKLWKYVGSPY